MRDLINTPILGVYSIYYMHDLINTPIFDYIAYIICEVFRKPTKYFPSYTISFA